MKSRFVFGGGRFLMLLAMVWNPVFSQDLAVPNGKCLTPLIVHMREVPEKRNRIGRFMSRPPAQVSVLSPSGKFRIHFDTTGEHTPAMVTGDGTRIPNSFLQYVDTVSRIFDHVWEVEITAFGFSAPPSDNNDGGGNEYDVYIQNIGAGNFGVTNWDTTNSVPPPGSNPRYPSWITIHSDFGKGFRTIGIPAAMVTAAHEFFHAIQVGGYGVWEEYSFYFYELTAEAMEPTVYPAVKDYINDIGNYFAFIENIPLYYAPQSDADPLRGYERAIWGIYLIKRFGVSFMKTMWEYISGSRPLPALENALSPKQSSLQREFAEFATWNVHTGGHADTIQYYTDGKLFPSVHFADTADVSGAPTTFQRSARSYTAYYIRATRNVDTTLFVVSNTNTQDALSGGGGTFAFTLRVSPHSESGSTVLQNGMSYLFTVTDPSNWSIAPVTPSGVAVFLAAPPFPNPFDPAKGTLWFPVPEGTGGSGRLIVLSSSFDLIADLAPGIVTFAGKRCMQWDGRDTRGNRVASGIYFYTIVDAGIERKGKFTVIR